MFKKTVLKNGVRIISEKLEHLKSVSLGIWVNTGSRDETEMENGISHFIEHMIFKGTNSRTSYQIAKELDAIGGMSNAFTSVENTCFYGKVLGKHFSTLSDILSDIFRNSTFDSNDMTRERQVILQEINMVEDTPDDIIHVLFSSLFWPDHPLGRPILGTEDTVSTIKKKHILKYIKENYTPEKIVVSAAGNVEHDLLVSFFEPRFSTLKKSVVQNPRTVPRINAGISINKKDLEQVHICLGGWAPSQKDETRFASAIFNTILGGSMSSRLFQEIRENLGLAYSIYSSTSAYMDTGLMSVYLATEPRDVNPALKIIQKETRKIIKDGVSASDLAAAKEHLIGGIYISAENTDNIMMRTAKNELVFERFISCEEIVSKLEKVSIEDVMEVAGRTFTKDRISLTTLGPIDEDEIDLSCIEF